MNEEILRIQRMVAEGKVSAEESVELLESLPAMPAERRTETGNDPGAAGAVEVCTPSEGAGAGAARRQVSRLWMWATAVTAAALAVVCFLLAIRVVDYWEAKETRMRQRREQRYAEAIEKSRQAWAANDAEAAQRYAHEALLFDRTAEASLLVSGRGLDVGQADSDSGKRSGETPKWLSEAHAKAYEALLPELDRLSAEELQRRAATLVGQALEPHRAELQERGRAALAELEPITLGDRQGWTRVASGDDLETKIQEEFRKVAPADSPGAAMLAIGLWNPRKAASMARSQFMAATLGAEAVGMRMALEMWAPAAVFVADTQPEHTVIVFETGPERFIVTLRLMSEGWYLPERTEWLRRGTAKARETADADQKAASRKATEVSPAESK